MARPGCPNRHRTKANKLEPSLEHSAKAACQREIPKDYGLEPRMWGQGIKEVHLKLTEFPSPPISVQCPQDWRGLSVEHMSGWGVELLWKNPGEWTEVFVRVSHPQHKPLLVLMTNDHTNHCFHMKKCQCPVHLSDIFEQQHHIRTWKDLVPRCTPSSWFRTTKHDWIFHRVGKDPDNTSDS